MSMIPAFSPGPCTTSFDRVGSRFKWTRDDLYEQCSLHITLKIPSSVSEGSRPSHFRTFLYSSGVMPCSATTSGVMAVAVAFGIRGNLIFARSTADSRIVLGRLILEPRQRRLEGAEGLLDTEVRVTRIRDGRLRRA